MSSLNSIDRKLLEDTLEMSSGYVLNFSARREFAGFMSDIDDCDIYANIYGFNGDSMAKRMRAYWTVEEDPVVSRAITHLLDYAEAFDLANAESISKCRKIITRLNGETSPNNTTTSKEAFLSQEFPPLDFQKLPIEGVLIPILEQRWEEAKRCADSEAYLSTVIQLGSMLEAVLFGMTRNNPKEFNQARSAPRKEGKALPFHDWSLANLIDSAREVGLLNEDVKQYSHSLRDFRNYVHPYKQLASQFTPDKDTATISLHVFRAAMNQIIGK
ncbi:hypothetical protein [Rubritalea tangerina]|uniref:AbiJ N-terminal domain-containing protein n=1 Tax=Rubritalea tangerina TaxID=430798 RepID=A0ABW4Z835_9BACT